MSQPLATMSWFSSLKETALKLGEHAKEVGGNLATVVDELADQSEHVISHAETLLKEGRR